MAHGIAVSLGLHRCRTGDDVIYRLHVRIDPLPTVIFSRNTGIDYGHCTKARKPLPTFRSHCHELYKEDR
ncbi:hypothetical protein OHAE_1566 [Ochrobactrum soli]|uniref:Uncharacterized protein n=1 Tax=Ochrobactrum soli TaxID=2448455 RepID=A0A2P9HNS1_9HYPH|nr:hypothetical protein OHAE_1566 [[Ochrobactrum] soli]